MMAICLSPCPLGLHSKLLTGEMLRDLQFATNIPTKEACVWCRGEGIDGREVEKTSLVEAGMGTREFTGLLSLLLYMFKNVPSKEKKDFSILKSHMTSPSL